MNVPLLDTLEMVERSIFHALREKLVEYGYLPDITQFTNDATGNAAYQAEIQSIKADPNKKFCIELFGVGSSQSKFLLKVPRMVIVSFGMQPGNIGVRTEGVEEFTTSDNLTRVRTTVIQSPAMDYNFEVHVICNTAKQSRVCQAILKVALPALGYIKQYEQPTRYLNIYNTGSRTIPLLTEGLIESVFSYTMKDLYEVDRSVVETNLAPINQIDVDINASENPPNDNTPPDVTVTSTIL